MERANGVEVAAKARPKNKMRDGLPPLPLYMSDLPIDKRGYPVPAFVATIKGEPDHRVAKAGWLVRCIKEKRCWLCGNEIAQGRERFSFVIGPMCVINQVSAEPPSHFVCASYAVRACPFMVRPAAERRDANLPGDATPPGGIMIPRNPGVMAVTMTRSYSAVRTTQGGSGSGGIILRLGPIDAVFWWREGRMANRQEVLDSINSGLPTLVEYARKEGREAEEELQAMTSDAMRWLPRENAPPLFATQ